MKKIITYIIAGFCLLSASPAQARVVLRARKTVTSEHRPVPPASAVLPVPADPPRPVQPGVPAVPRPIPAPAPVPVRPAPEPVPFRRPVATPEQVRAIVECLENQSSDGRRLEVANLCVMLTSVNVKGLRLMAQTLSFDSNRLDFLKRSYAACPDKADYPELRSVLSFRSHREELLEFIARAR